MIGKLGNPLMFLAVVLAASAACLPGTRRTGSRKGQPVAILAMLGHLGKNLGKTKGSEFGPLRCKKLANDQEHSAASSKNWPTFSKTAKDRQVIWRTN
jgi:hypothetical protein